MVEGNPSALGLQKERKNRRISTHDERRRSSGLGGARREANTQTDALECKCEEYKNQLFIKNSEIFALDLELRNHPLKAEKVRLTKRIQEDQEAHRLEIKKYREMLENCEKKYYKLKNEVSKETNSTAMPKNLSNTQTSPIKWPEVSTASSETQTDGDLDRDFHKLTIKYNDLKKICRSRYKTIVNLEKQLEVTRECEKFGTESKSELLSAHKDNENGVENASGSKPKVVTPHRQVLS